MTRRVVLVDDVDGSEADETCRFPAGGVWYEIDLSQANASKFREAVAATAPFVEAARQVTVGGEDRPPSEGLLVDVVGTPASGGAASPNSNGGHSRRRATPPSAGKRKKRGRGGERGPSTADIRAWAKVAGVAVSDRGRIPETVIQRYELEHQGA